MGGILGSGFVKRTRKVSGGDLRGVSSHRLGSSNCAGVGYEGILPSTRLAMMFKTWCLLSWPFKPYSELSAFKEPLTGVWVSLSTCLILLSCWIEMT